MYVGRLTKYNQSLCEAEALQEEKQQQVAALAEENRRLKEELDACPVAPAALEKYRKHAKQVRDNQMTISDLQHKVDVLRRRLDQLEGSGAGRGASATKRGAAGGAAGATSGGGGGAAAGAKPKLVVLRPSEIWGNQPPPSGTRSTMM